MNIELLEEPDLEFAGGGRHVDIRFGIKEHGTLDSKSRTGPRTINVGFVGTYETIEGVSNWLRKCKDVIPAKKTKQPNLRPDFPGFNQEGSFNSKLEWETTTASTISNSQFTKLKSHVHNAMVTDAVGLLADEIEYLSDKANTDVIICALPLDLLDMISAASDAKTRRPSQGRGRPEPKLDLHDLLKATLMEKRVKVPIQIVLPATYDESKRQKQQATEGEPKRLQDEATRAWNFHTALYYKAAGTPWRLVRDRSRLTSCYIGVSFFTSPDRTRMFTSTAQVFDERGEGVIVRGGTAAISNEDRQPHMSRDGAQMLLTLSMQNYKREHRTLPARVVLHKSSAFNREEAEGFRAALEDLGIEDYDFISLNKSFTRLFRTGIYPPLRGTLLTVEEKQMLLYTRGSVKFFETYTGIYPPRTLRINAGYGNQTPRYIAEEILALTKMNWNNTQFDGSEPITLRAARQVGQILKHLDESATIQQFYRFYM